RISLAQDDCTGQGLTAGDQCGIAVEYVPQVGVEERVTLVIRSTDAVQPEWEIPLVGRVGAADQRMYLPLVQMVR
ncbi:MAG: hypothetical protein HC837_18865, partial [Chloroflexaceae bacterium]|nr:hypothetical protein [Chloroflexaceae bacterium]